MLFLKCLLHRNIELEDKLHILEKQYALTTHKCNLATQLAEEQQKKITDLQVALSKFKIYKIIAQQEKLKIKN